MVRMFVRHPVSYFAKWKAAYDEFDGPRRKLGVQGDAVFQSTADPKDVTVWHDFEDMKSAQAFAASDELRSAMSRAGVAGEPTIWFTEPVGAP